MLLDFVKTAKNALDYDPETGVFTWKIAPARKPSFVGKEAGCVSRGYRRIKIGQETVFAHRLAWAWVHGEEPPAVIDHIDRDKGNNAISNLRDGSESVNQFNRASAGRTGISGVVLQDKKPQRPFYQVWFGRDNVLGYTKDFFEACCLRKSAEARYWGATA